MDGGFRSRKLGGGESFSNDRGINIRNFQIYKELYLHRVVVPSSKKIIDLSNLIIIE